MKPFHSPTHVETTTTQMLIGAVIVVGLAVLLVAASKGRDWLRDRKQP